MAHPYRRKGSQSGQGFSGAGLSTRPSPEVPGKPKTRPFTRLTGGQQASDSITPSPGANAWAGGSSADMKTRGSKVNPIAGSGQDVEKVANYDEGTTQAGMGSGPQARYLGESEKGHGRTVSVGRGAAMRARKKMRAAFGQGGMQMPMQSGNSASNGALRGGQAPPSYPGRSGPSWPANKGGFTATKSKTTLSPGHK